MVRSVPRATLPACRVVPRLARLGLAAAAALLLLSAATPASAAVTTMRLKVSQEGGVAVLGLVAGLGAEVDPMEPTKAGLMACAGFDPGGYEVFGLETGGPIMVFVGFLGPSGGIRWQDLVPSASDPLGQEEGDAETGTLAWAYVPGTPLANGPPEPIRDIPAPRGTSWGMWGAGVSQSGCP